MEQRRNAIVELVNREGSLSFVQLKEAFPSVSEMTLRTDLKALDQARRVVRVHGGVKSVEVVVGTDDQFGRRTARNASAGRPCLTWRSLRKVSSSASRRGESA